MSKKISKLGALANRFFPTKLKTLYQAGFVDRDMELTDEGVKELESILVQEYIDKLEASAKERLADKKKKKSK